MDIDPTQLVSGLLANRAPSSSDQAPKADERQKIAKLAHEFEAMMLVQVLRQMRQTILSDGEDGNGLGADTMRDTIDTELAQHLSATGGLGLAVVLQRALDQQLAHVSGATAQPSVPLPPPERMQNLSVAHIAAANIDSEAALPLPFGARVTSHYGWRPDPFGDGVRFHRGIDLAAAYGHDVPVVAAGRVTFAGSEAGYGNMVIVEHPGGITTRYAHLMTTDVRAGDEVKAGAVIGRVGSTGRSTGPHLHFEVLQDGKQVSPEMAAARFDERLKNLRPVPINP